MRGRAQGAGVGGHTRTGARGRAQGAGVGVHTRTGAGGGREWVWGQAISHVSGSIALAHNGAFMRPSRRPSSVCAASEAYPLALSESLSQMFLIENSRPYTSLRSSSSLIAACMLARSPPLVRVSANPTAQRPRISALRPPDLLPTRPFGVVEARAVPVKDVEAVDHRAGRRTSAGIPPPRSARSPSARSPSARSPSARSAIEPRWLLLPRRAFQRTTRARSVDVAANAANAARIVSFLRSAEERAHAQREREREEEGFQRREKGGREEEGVRARKGRHFAKWRETRANGGAERAAGAAPRGGGGCGGGSRSHWRKRRWRRERRRGWERRERRRGRGKRRRRRRRSG